MASWHRSEYVSIPAAKTRRYLLVIALTGAFGGVSLATALPDPPAPADKLMSAYSTGSAGGGAMRNIIEEHSKARAVAKATTGKVSAAGEPSTGAMPAVNRPSAIGKPSTVGAAKRAAAPPTTGSVGRASSTSAAVRKVRVAGGDDSIARWLRKNGVLDSSGTSSGGGPVIALNR